MKKPCKTCPFSRTGEHKNKPDIGGSLPEKYLGQIRGPFYLPCHNSKNYSPDTTTRENTHSCAGAAIFRANSKIPYKLPEGILILPEDHELVFSNEEEFYEHYYGESSEDKLSPEYLDYLLKRELTDAGVRRM